MSAVLEEDRPSKDEPNETKPRSFFARLIGWYRRAAIKPTTEEEQAEWQQDSF